MIDILPGLQSTTAALAAGRTRMDVVSQNIANAEVSRGADGRPYERKQVVFEAVLASHQEGLEMPTVKVARVQGDGRAPRMMHKPGHPEADANGMVAMPNINIHEEMVDLISAARSFEANLAVVRTARMMATQTLGIGKK